jgi:uncharacterized membrane protein YeaQ/YmgE (transglycosylase-associated protein family)
MADIFISYRRIDSATFTGRIYDRLTARLGRDRVFKDVDDIPAGENFAQYIQNSLRQCAVALIVIGPRWLEARDETGARRLDDPGDFVRLEIETALRLGLTVIPLLVDDARMPGGASLPMSVRPLATLNALLVRNDPDFSRDMERVIASIECVLAARSAPTPAPYIPERSAPCASVASVPVSTPHSSRVAARSSVGSRVFRTLLVVVTIVISLLMISNQSVYGSIGPVVSILAWIIVGGIAGWLASLVVQGTGMGILGDISGGILGALIGGFVLSLLLPGTFGISGFNLGSLVVAFIGAVILLFIVRLFTGDRAVS